MPGYGIAEKVPKPAGQQGRLFGRGILRLGFDGCAGVPEFGKGGSELGPGLVRPGAAGPAEGLACRTWASGGGSGRLPASCHLALF